MKPKVLIWEGCYESGWKGVITPDSFWHPAKFSRSLIDMIFKHCLFQGYLSRGDLVGDPFGGIGTGGITAAYHGLKWVGVELEPRFVEMANANFQLHADKWETLRVPQPTIAQGDSRQFDQVVDGIVTSPPFTTDQPCASQSRLGGAISGSAKRQNGMASEGNIQTLREGTLGAVVTSPPYADKLHGGGMPSTPRGDEKYSKAMRDCYHEATNQIGNLKAGSLDGAVMSPPYSDIAAGAGGLNTKPPKHAGQQSGRKASSSSQQADQRYGEQPGQIAKLKDTGVSAVITSPPYAESLKGHADGIDWDKAKQNGELGEGHSKGKSCHSIHGNAEGQIATLREGKIDVVVTSPPWEENSAGGVGANRLKDPEKFAIEMSRRQRGHYGSPEARKKQFARDARRQYGDSEGQIGKENGETYWQAMLQVYSACFRSIKPTGIIAVVVKDYVKNKQRVPLCDDTARLLEHIGFRIVERAHAMLVNETRHGDLFTGEDVQKKSRKSFFRRLAEKKGSPEINFEEVIFARRP